MYIKEGKMIILYRKLDVNVFMVKILLELVDLGLIPEKHKRVIDIPNILDGTEIPRAIF